MIHSAVPLLVELFPLPHYVIIISMILVTGGTGFVGRALIRQLVANGEQVRTLIRPSPRTPNLPRGVPVEVAVAGLGDERSLRAGLMCSNPAGLFKVK